MRVDALWSELASIAELGPIQAGRSGRASPSVADAALDVAVDDVVHDSRVAAAGALFCAVPGLTVDGHDFVAAAAAAGASAALVEHFVDVDIAQLRVGDVRTVMAHAAAIVHGRPSEQLSVFGITGTNGKTTTTQLVADIVRNSGRSCEVIGTLGGLHTTPESTDLQRQLRAMRSRGVDVVALEVSSHALDMRRVDATRFAVAAFSNLTPDHLDYHADMESYFRAKSLLFDGRAEAEVINVDDPWGARLARQRPDATTVSLDEIDIESETITGSTFRWQGVRASIALPGRMNIANAVMAAESARLLGLDEATVAAGLASARPVPGRMQVVAPRSGVSPTVVVDYSHTPDSIELALATLRAASPEAAVAIVFGCGGDRDRQKRPLMAAAAERGADRVYLTSDNPRSEDPMAIIADAMVGFETPARVVIEPDRRRAIEHAIIESEPGDVVLIAGKGHEKTQTIGSDVLPFDDVKIADEILQAPRP